MRKSNLSNKEIVWKFVWKKKEWGGTGGKHFTRNAIGIWLTPLLKIDEVYQALLNTEVPSLCIIGDQDHHFIKERITSFENNHHIQTLVVSNTEHSLEVKGNVQGTLDAMKEVMKSIDDFVAKNKI